MSSQISTICILLVTTSLPQKNTLLNVIAKLPEIAVGTSVIIKYTAGFESNFGVFGRNVRTGGMFVRY